MQKSLRRLRRNVLFKKLRPTSRYQQLVADIFLLSETSLFPSFLMDCWIKDIKNNPNLLILERYFQLIQGTLNFMHPLCCVIRFYAAIAIPNDFMEAQTFDMLSPHF